LEELSASIGHQPWSVGALFLGDSTSRSPGLEARSSDVGDALDVVNLIGTALGVTFELASATHPATDSGRPNSEVAHELILGELICVKDHLKGDKFW